MPALLQKAHYCIHRGPRYLREQNQKHSFVILPYCSPCAPRRLDSRGHELLVLFVLRSISPLRRMESHLGPEIIGGRDLGRTSLKTSAIGVRSLKIE